MSVAWSSLTFASSPEALQELGASWGWLLREPFTPVLFSSLGDVFIEPDSGGVWWLNTGTAELTRVADSVAHFESLLNSELADEWFMPNLVGKLHAAGKVPGLGECYTFVTSPVFREGKYEVENLNPVPAREHYGLTGWMQKQLRSHPRWRTGASQGDHVVKTRVTRRRAGCGHYRTFVNERDCFSRIHAHTQSDARRRFGS